MNKRNQFELLSKEDQTKIIELCDQHPYAHVVDILAEPRPVGLEIVTSISSLWRFYTRRQDNASEALQTNQFGNALQIRRQAAPGACITGILALCEHRILDSLKKGRPLSDMATEIRLLKMVHTTFLADERERRENEFHDTAYQKYIDSQSHSPDPDYIRMDLENDPGAQGVAPYKFQEYPEEAWDIFQQRARNDREYKAMFRQNRTVQAHAGASKTAALPEPSAEFSTDFPPNMPVIPHFSQNSNFVKNEKSAPTPQPQDAQKPAA